MKTHQIASHDMTWHLATNHITSPHVTSQPTALLHRSLQPTTSKQVTASPPWNGWRLVHSNNSVWASQWLVTLCTFYRQILSLTYSFFLWNFRPRLARLYLYIAGSPQRRHIYIYMDLLKGDLSSWDIYAGLLKGDILVVSSQETSMLIKLLQQWVGAKAWHRTCGRREEDWTEKQCMHTFFFLAFCRPLWD